MTDTDPRVQHSHTSTLNQTTCHTTLQHTPANMAPLAEYGALLKKQASPQKLIFLFLFWGLHWGLFAYGW